MTQQFFISLDDRGPCYEAYRQSSLTHLQMSFEQFREMDSDTASASGDLATTHERSALGKEGGAM